MRPVGVSNLLECLVLLLVTILVLTNASTDKAVLEYRLQNTSAYVAFSADLDVKYSLPADEHTSVAFMRLMSLLPTPRVITSVTLPPGKNGELTITCGVIDHAGQVQFHLIDSYNRTLAETPLLAVSWPKVTLSLPATHTALSDEVIMGIVAKGVACDSIHPGNQYYIEVVYYGRNDTKGSVRVVEPRQTIHEAPFPRLFDAETTLNCAMFDQEGVYQAFLRADANPRIPVATSNEMHVRWSPVYRLTTAVESIFPCTKHIVIRYVQPRCSGTDDKIRLFQMLRRLGGSVASPLDQRYITERRAQANANAVSFECGFFSEDAIGYCFQYISTANSGAVSEQKSICLPTTNSSGVSADGSWGTWSSWTSCVGNCGSAVQTRFRTCDNPPPSANGNFCAGNMRETKPCDILCVGSTPESSVISGPEESCDCGCLLQLPEGQISFRSDRCQGGTAAIWHIVTTPDRVIELTYFLRGSVDQSGRAKNWIKIRDGDSAQASLLAHTSGGSKAETVRGTQQAMVVEVWRSGRGEWDSSAADEDTFSGSYTSLLRTSNDSLLVHQSPDGGHWLTNWRILAIVGGVILVCVVLAVVAIIYLHKRFINGRRQMKKSQVGQALLRHRHEADVRRDHNDGPNAYYSFADTSTPPESPSRGYLLSHSAYYHSDPSHTDSPGRKFPLNEKGIVVLTADMTYESCPPRTDVVYGPQCIPMDGLHNPYSHPDQNPPDYCPTGSPNLPFRPSQTSDQHPPSPENHQGALFKTPLARNSRSTSPPTSPTSDLASSIANSDHNRVTPPKPPDDLKNSDNRFRLPAEGSNASRPRTATPTATSGKDKTPPDSTDPHTTTKKGTTKDRARDHGSPPYRAIRGAARPDGQSPEAQTEMTSIAQTPPSSARSVDASPSIGGNSRLFPDALSVNTLSDIGSQDGFEYDDYIPQLPGSFFNMDPQAYTLTWSKPPQLKTVDGAGSATGKSGAAVTGTAKIASFSGSEASIGS